MGNLIEDIAKIESGLKTREQTLGASLNEPFNITNSASRKNMYITHQSHRIAVENAEPPLVSTGYENEFGEYSSAFGVTDRDKYVIAKIPKFSWIPNHHYIMVVVDNETNVVDIIERISYKHITESHGYLNNNSYLDSLNPGDMIRTGSVFKKSESYDEYNNRKDGINLVTAYIACDGSMEDGNILSKSASEKLVSPLIKSVEVVINDNDIMLNMHGDENNYKVLPDIGEKSKDILCALRRENKEDIFFAQSYDMLRNPLMSDTIYTVDGEIIDIDINCNNPTLLKSSKYNAQLARYYDECQRFAAEYVNCIKDLLESGYTLGYYADKLYYISKQKLNGAQYTKDKPFSNIVMNIYLLERNKISIGDKLSDRYGGKGVVSQIVPDEFMPRLEDGTVVELIHNSSTCIARENPGQLFELSVNHIARYIQKYILLGVLDLDSCVDMYVKFMTILSQELGEYVEHTLNHMDEDSRKIFMDEVCNDIGIMTCLQPISESMSIDKLNELYKEFPFVKQDWLYSTMVGSDGSVRYVKSCRPIVVGKKYIYRLKQYAEEKFSVTSLSATNIRNENSRSKANKSYKAHYAKTPIKFGEMETGDLAHMGMEAVITNLMIHSASPHARRLAEQLLTGNPFKIDIKLDENSSNRSVEILNSYLKTMGLKLVFTKVLKKITPAFMVKDTFIPLVRYDDKGNLLDKDVQLTEAFRIIDDNVPVAENYAELLNKEYEESPFKWNDKPAFMTKAITTFFTVEEEEKLNKEYEEAKKKRKY